MAQLLKQTFVDDYLKRLQYSGPVSPDLQTLKTLHRLHLLNIPFENLNNLVQEEYCTTKEDLYKKIVQGKRGGICCELNTLFGLLLRDIGFSLIFVEATCSNGSSWDPYPDHQMCVVSLGEEKWMADVGFGECFAEPLRLVEDEIQDDGYAEYRIRKECDQSGQAMMVLESTTRNAAVLHVLNTVEQRESRDWKYVYKFDVSPRTLEHFSYARNMMLNDPSSPLNQGLLCTLLRPWGRITASRYKLIKKYVKDKNILGKEVKILESQDEVFSVLESEFGVTIHAESPLKLA